MSVSKQDQLDGLYQEYKKQFEGEQIVLGEGNTDAVLMLIGEAPGKDEVKLSKPFVGAAGKNLSEFLNMLGMSRESIYITNTIKYRLSKISPKTGGLINRPAKKQEIQQNRDYLLKEINLVQPAYIVTLGNVPLRAVTGDYHMNIGSVHGQLHEINIADKKYQLYPLYHPASIIYNSSLKEVYAEDIKRLKNIINN